MPFFALATHSFQRAALSAFALLFPASAKIALRFCAFHLRGVSMLSHSIAKRFSFLLIRCSALLLFSVAVLCCSFAYRFGASPLRSYTSLSFAFAYLRYSMPLQGVASLNCAVPLLGNATRGFSGHFLRGASRRLPLPLLNLPRLRRCRRIRSGFDM